MDVKKREKNKEFKLSLGRVNSKVEQGIFMICMHKNKRKVVEGV